MRDRLKAYASDQDTTTGMADTAGAEVSSITCAIGQTVYASDIE